MAELTIKEIKKGSKQPKHIKTIGEVFTKNVTDSHFLIGIYMMATMNKTHQEQANVMKSLTAPLKTAPIALLIEYKALCFLLNQTGAA